MITTIISYSYLCFIYIIFFFFCHDTATPEIYTLSLHDALPISNGLKLLTIPDPSVDTITVHIVYLVGSRHEGYGEKDRKSTRLNSSHRTISYAVFCLKKKKKIYRSIEQDKKTSITTFGQFTKHH